ncbi:Glycogen synthase [Fundidesulfovibrio magnetotacticus]|uniref:Glycogen synthase n=1 Tax=Fundidesulfovibrio magnetotacticus TaxID=2730080 RepID=A0A6V8M0G2_9BACT|nr:glycosyltransferase family 4 protein [Fundidesulfovibrio magnetotacticus]GFK95729.1 Glycogen synthase [Fundidesulfovibrio magnetotacticus]
MRLLLVNYEYPPLGGGAGNATANIAREMTLLGARVMVLTSAFRGLPRHETVQVPGGASFEIARIPTVRRHADRCAAWEMAAFMASSCLTLPLAARAFRPDGAVAFFGIPGGPSAWILKALAGTPYVVSLRGGDVPGFQPYDLAAMHRLTGPLIRFLWRRALAVVPNSRGLAALARAFEPGLAYPVIPNGVDPERYAPRQGAREPGPMRLFFHGRVVRQKGLDVLVQALAQLPRGLAWELSIAGDGPARPGLESQLRALGLADRVRFLGWMDRADIALALRRADLFVFPSRDEGMPNAVLEAMASGLPVLATAISGNEDLALPGRTGLTVPPEDAGALAGALARLLADPPLLEAMGREARALVLEHYSWRSVAERYLALFGDRPCAA